jgi:hypothetical protein
MHFPAFAKTAFTFRQYIGFAAAGNCFNFSEFYYTENQLITKKFKSHRKFLSLIETKAVIAAYKKA